MVALSQSLQLIMEACCGRQMVCVPSTQQMLALLGSMDKGECCSQELCYPLDNPPFYLRWHCSGSPADKGLSVPLTAFITLPLGVHHQRPSLGSQLPPETILIIPALCGLVSCEPPKLAGLGPVKSPSSLDSFGRGADPENKGVSLWPRLLWLF